MIVLGMAGGVSTQPIGCLLWSLESYALIPNVSERRCMRCWILSRVLIQEWVGLQLNGCLAGILTTQTLDNFASVEAHTGSQCHTMLKWLFILDKLKMEDIRP